MKRWYVNLMLRLAFRVFRRYHAYLSPEINTIIWGEITRKRDYDELSHDLDPTCSTCVRELEEDRERQEKIKRWLKGEIV